MISDKDKTEFLEVVKTGFEEGYFEITDADNNFGCNGLYCKTPDYGFYCLGEGAEDWEGTPKEYVEYVGTDNIYQSVASVILDMYEDELDSKFTGEAYMYLLDLTRYSNAPVLNRLIELGKNAEGKE